MQRRGRSGRQGRGRGRWRLRRRRGRQAGLVGDEDGPQESSAVAGQRLKGRQTDKGGKVWGEGRGSRKRGEYRKQRCTEEQARRERRCHTSAALIQRDAYVLPNKSL